MSGQLLFLTILVQSAEDGFIKMVTVGVLNLMTIREMLMSH